MNSRARHRLVLARDLMALAPELSPEETLAALNLLGAGERDAMRSRVDWVEDYEKHERQL